MSTYSDKAIEVIEQTLGDIDEGGAFAIFHAFKRRFDWAGTVFCPDDIRNQIANNRGVEFDDIANDPDVEKIVDHVIGDYRWCDGLEDWLTEKGWECVYDAVCEAEADLGLEQS